MWAVVSALLCTSVGAERSWYVRVAYTSYRRLQTPRPSLCVCVWKVHCGKTADWIWMPFGVVSGGELDVGVLDFGGDRRMEGQIWGVNLGRPIVTNGAFATRSSQITLRTC